MELTTACQSREEHEAARLESLQRAIGFDALYVGAALPDDSKPEPSVSGVSKRHAAKCESNAERYWGDRLSLTHQRRVAEAAAGGEANVLVVGVKDLRCLRTLPAARWGPRMAKSIDLAADASRLASLLLS